MHIGYAIQWFAFALIALVIWLRLSLHRTEQNRC
jgi:cytochrome oxidase assembly protein ShyY1